MKPYRITATLLAPLSIQQKRQSDAAPGLPYLPGSSLRGAVAAKYLRTAGTPEDDIFQRLFVQQPVRFPDLLPAQKNETSRPLPLTAVSCKRSPGFLDDKKQHGVTDTLAVKYAARFFPELGSETDCPVCGQAMKNFTGFWNGNLSLPCTNRPTMFYQRHTGIDRDTGAIATSIFYTTQAMADFQKKPGTEAYIPQMLSGVLYLDDSQYQMLSSLLEDTLFAGADRTRGLGELEASLAPIEPVKIDIRNWSDAFKNKLASLCGGMPDEARTGHFFSITLKSHTIIVDRFLRPSAELPLGIKEAGQELRVVKAQTLHGWNDAWGLPKPDDTGLIMGSVFLFRCTGDNIPALETHLEKIAVNGIGLRREEGFGQVVICDPIHILNEEVI